MKTFKKAALAAAMIVGSSQALAASFYICPPSAGGGCTSVFEEMNFQVNAESHYVDVDANSGISGGDIVVDMTASSPPSLVTGFSPTVPFVTTNQSYGTDWFLEFRYTDLTGVVLPGQVFDGTTPLTSGNANGIGEVGETIQVGAFYNTGTIEVYYQDALTDTHVLDFKVNSGLGDVANVVLLGDIDFTALDAAEYALAESMFFLSDGTAWVDADDGVDMNLIGRSDSNQDPGLVALDATAGFDFLRTASLDGSFRIPVPTPLALMGLCLVGLGFARSRKA